MPQAWGENWKKVLEYKYKYLKKWREQVQVLDFEKYKYKYFEKYSSTSTEYFCFKF